MLVTITLTTEVNDKPFTAAVKLDVSKVSEDLIEHSLLGEIGEPFKALLLAAKRATLTTTEVQQ